MWQLRDFGRDHVHPTSFYMFVDIQSEQKYTQIFADYYTIRCAQ